ncbi:MAG: glucosaminidase domain-containing protein [Bacillota bacterium]
MTKLRSFTQTTTSVLRHGRWRAQSQRRRAAIALLVFALVAGIAPRPASAAPMYVRLMINGVRIAATPAPFVENGRTLAPLRLISEKLDATVDWKDGVITITRGDTQVVMRVDSHFVSLAQGGATITDVPPRYYGSSTYIPLRLFATALGVSVAWDQATSTVKVDSRVPVSGTPPKVIAITSVQPGQVVADPTPMQMAFVGDKPAGAVEVRYQLIDPATGKGPVVGRGTDLTAAYTLLPDPLYNGPRVLAAALYDQNGTFLVGDAVPITMAPSTRVILTGPVEGQTVTGPLALGAKVNFQVASMKWEVINPSTGTATSIGTGDPEGTVTWYPQMTDNGSRTFKATAYDRLGQAHPSETVTMNVQVERKTALSGVKSGGTVDKPVTLAPNVNWVVNLLQYILRDPATGAQEVLYQHAGWDSYRWYPTPAQSGNREIYMAVTDAQGNQYSTTPVPILVKGDPQVRLLTIGPDQVLNGKVSLKAESNVPLTQVEYQLIDPKTGAARAVAGGADATVAYSWTPVKTDDGNWQFRVMGVTADGAKLYSPAVAVRVYSGTLYTAKPVMDKALFQPFASDLAVKTMQKTGMSAALQVAQAILESGWGQSAPVDKYTGKLSNNLFGIKGSGPAGSVISNTWEEYSGVVYYIDANFRAYNSPSESWDDHQQLLLTKPWYAPYRAVMYDSTQGAWALKRSGYATDSQYPIKLIDIIKRYGLWHLDEVGI